MLTDKGAVNGEKWILAFMHTLQHSTGEALSLLNAAAQGAVTRAEFKVETRNHGGSYNADGEFKACVYYGNAATTHRHCDCYMLNYSQGMRWTWTSIWAIELSTTSL